MAKIGANDSCPCGSGKKYKKCCQFKDDQAKRDLLHEKQDDRLDAAMNEAKKNLVPEGSEDKGALYDFALPLLIQRDAQAGHSYESSIMDLATMLFNCCLKRKPEERDESLRKLGQAFVKRRVERENFEALSTIMVRRFSKLFPRIVSPEGVPALEGPEGWMIAAPLSELLRMGHVSLEMVAIQYTEMGIGEDAIPDLIRMIRSDAFWRAPSPTNWAPLHAWRALTQLKAKDAIDELLQVVKGRSESHIVQRDLPLCLGQLGPEVLSGVWAIAQDTSLPVDARIIGIKAIGYVGKYNPTEQDECGKFLREMMSKDESINLNGAAAAAYLECILVDDPGKEIEELLARDRLPKELGGLEEMRKNISENLAFRQITNDLYIAAGQRV